MYLFLALCWDILSGERSFGTSVTEVIGYLQPTVLFNFLEFGSIDNIFA